MNWESITDIYTLPCIKRRASGKLLPSTGSSARRCDDLEGWGGWGWSGAMFKKEGIYVYTQLMHFTVQQKRTQHYVKQLYSNF